MPFQRNDCSNLKIHGAFPVRHSHTPVRASHSSQAGILRYNEPMKHLPLLRSLGFAALLFECSSHATTRSFSCNSVNNQWSVATNWIPNGVPQNGDVLVFSASSSRRDCINDLINLKLDSIQVTASGYEISGNALTITNGIIAANATLFYLYPDITLGKSQTFSIDGSSSVRVYSDFSLNGFNLTLDTDSYLETHGGFTGTGNLTKFGTGELLMAGSPNTFSGTFTHNGGQFSIAKSSCLPTNYYSYGLTKIYNSSATHTNGDITLYPGAKIIGNSATTNTLRNLTLHGGIIEDLALTFALRGNLTSLVWSAQSQIIAHLDLLNTNHIFHINDGIVDKDLVIEWGSIRGGTSAGYTKTGTGKLHLHDLTTTYGGTNHVVAGIIEGGMGGGLLGSGRTVVYDGASIQALSGSGMSSYFELHGNGVSGTNGAIRGLGFCQMYGPFLIMTSATIRGDGPLHLSGNIGGFGALHIGGTNEVWTEGASGNTLIGGYWVDSGTFVLNKPAGTTAIGSSIVVGSDGLFDVQPATLRNYDNEQIVSHVTVATSGRYDLNGKTETVPSIDLYNASEVFMDGGTLILAGDLEVIPALFASAPATFDGGGYLNVGSGTRNLIINDIPIVGSDALELDLVSTTLSGSASILKKGAGDMRISYDTSHTGTFTIEAGDVEVRSISPFGSSGASTVVTGPGALVMSGSAFSDTEPMTFNGTGRVDSATLVIKDDTSLRGPMSLQQATRMFVNTNFQFALRSIVSGTGSIIKEGLGEMLFDWDRTNTFTGGLVVEDGLVTLDRDSTNVTIVSDITVGDGIGAAGSAKLASKNNQQIGNSVDVTLASDGRFTVTNMNDAEIIRRLQGVGQLYVYGYGLRLNDSGNDSTFSGSINGTGDLIKAGTGKFTHNGNCGASGLTLSMFGGTTAINGTWNASPTPTLIDAYSGTTLAGEGTVQDVNIRSGGVLAPGNSPGKFTLNNITMVSGANLFMELRGAIPGVEHDQVVAKTSVNISNASLTLSLNYPPVDGQVLRLVDNQSANPILGTFSGKAQGSIVTISGNQFVISYTGGTGNDVTLTATNSKLALAAAIIPSGNGLVDAGECNELLIVLTNKSGGSLSGVTATLDSRSPAIAVSQQASAYPNFTSNSARTNSTAFRITSLPGFECGQLVELQLTVSISGSTFAIPVTLTTGTLGAPFHYSPREPFAVNIPDNGTTNTTLNIANFPSRVGKVAVSFNIAHTYDGDLDVYLQSPSGTTVKLVADRGGSGDNFGTSCSPNSARTMFDDNAATAIASGVAPFTGSFRPEEPLAAFISEDADGAWKLIMTDDANNDIGVLNCWTLDLYPVTCTAESASSCQPCTAQTLGALNAQSPTMPNRIFRDANPSVCGETKLCPGTSVAAGPFRYATHTFTNTGPSGCMTVVLQDHCANQSLFAAAYLGAFNPADLCANYLADIGTNALAPSMSFYVVTNGVFTVVVNELIPGSSCPTYDLEIFGLPCPAPILQIEPAPAGQVRLFWNAIGGDGYDLQAAPAVAGATFTNLGVPPAFVNGTLNVTNSATDAQKYFRLKKP